MTDDATGLGQTQSFSITVQAAPAFQYVRQLYRDLLGREADPAGLLSWAMTFQTGMSRSAIADGIWTSAEHRGLQVDSYYAAYLHRAADPAGRLYWIHAFQVGMSERDVERAFLTSREYAKSHSSAVDYVLGLYTDVLGRSPHKGSLGYWLNAASHGTNRSRMASRFLTLNETYHNIITHDYQRFLNRPPVASEKASWTRFLRRTAGSRAGVAKGLLVTNEYWTQALAKTK